MQRKQNLGNRHTARSDSINSGPRIYGTQGLTPGKTTPITKLQRIFNVAGFDIETYGPDNKLVCGSLVYPGGKFFSRDKYKLLDKIKELAPVTIVATNLNFDFFGTFNSDELQSFKFCWRQGKLITACTYVKPNGEFTKYVPHNNKLKKIVFTDTMNYAPYGVARLGTWIGIPKLKEPACFKRLPRNNAEWLELEEYNIRDSLISQVAYIKLIKEFIKLGANARPTIASTAMSLFRNKYLDRTYKQPYAHILLDFFKGYYGGRTEAFSRGLIDSATQGQYYYYDCNSMYSTAMLEEYPDPDTLRQYEPDGSDYYINMPGISHVDITTNGVPMEYPLLPYRYNGKLTFPTGSWSGWYDHLSLQKAKANGYVITKIHKGYYCTGTCTPFRRYVTDLYAMRKDSQVRGDGLDLVYKLLLNSLYGKFRAAVY
jgi:hypothetical protein